MSRELIESIVAGDFVCANELFEEQLNILREQKLYEEKRRMAAKEKPFIQNTKADWAKYRKQNPSVKWNENKQGEKVVEKPKPTPFGKGGKLSAADIKARRKAGYIKASDAINAQKFIDAVKAHHAKSKQLKEMRASDPGYWSSQNIDNRIQMNEPPREMPPIGGKGSGDSSTTSQGKPIDVSGVKKLQKSKMKDDSHKTMDKFQKSMERLKRLKAGGYSPERAAAKEAKLKQAYRGVRAKHAAKTAVNVGKKGWSAWGNVVRSGMSGALEE